MMDTDKINALVEALHNLFGNAPSQHERGQAVEGEPSSKPQRAAKTTSVAIVSVGKPSKGGTAIPKLPVKKDSRNVGPVGSGKKGGKGE